ncbi:sucrose phosphorylase [Aurantibacter sp.]|uniref:sucrose phosphorylase n=1 Tax=Aurantibacter sp. TaxID=2807103 RepID=UPI0032646E5D
MKNKIQLITYVNRIGCANISELNSLVKNEFNGLFGGVHILPFFNPIDGADAGFDPIDHTQIDPRIGDWENIKELTSNVDVMSDLIVNHISAESKQFKDFLEKGKQSEFADLILTKDKVFSTGVDPSKIAKIYRPRPGLPFTEFKLNDGSVVSVWTTFTANQIDIDVLSQMGQEYLESILDTFYKAGITMIRLDAAGYAIKKPGTSCFMIDETYEFIANLTHKARKRGIEVLVEIHSFYKTQIQIAKRVDFVYDFALPVLVLDCLFNKNANNLKKWVAVAPRNVITVLDTHDGIGIVDVASENEVAGLINDEDLNEIVERIHVNSKNTSKRATGAAASNLDLYQVNCTYYDALGQDDNQYLMARAIQFFVPGIPQVYYVGLFAGKNDMQLLSETNVGRDINRHYFTKGEIKSILKSDLFLRMKKLMLFRNSHIAFNGEFEIVNTSQDVLHLKWKNMDAWATLNIELATAKMTISYTQIDGTVSYLF